MTGVEPNRWWGAAMAAVMVLVTNGCVSAPVDEFEAAEVHTESRVAPTALDVRAEGQDRAVRRATLRVRQRSCFGVGVGSGFAVTDKVLVTNRHVVQGADELQVSTWDGRSFDVAVSGIATADDLALVQVRGTLPQTLELHEPPDPGDEVTAVGYPGGGELNFSAGRVVDNVDGPLLGQLTSSIRVTNDIRQGNSGGPLLDTDGRVVGVVYAIERSTGYGLAVPIDALARALATADLFTNPSPC